MTRRLTALVIGNADYTDAGKLKNPGNDATDISAKLNECGFTVTTRLNCSHREMDQALKDFKTTHQASSSSMRAATIHSNAPGPGR